MWKEKRNEGKKKKKCQNLGLGGIRGGLLVGQKESIATFDTKQ